MKIEESKAVIFGAGSIGERHINNLLTLGCKNIFVYRQRNLPLRNVLSSKITVFTNLDELDKINPDFAIITSPTSQHLNQSLECVKRKIPVLVEKPLSHSLQAFEDLKVAIKGNNSLLHVGYMMRYHPLLKKVKEFCESGQYGKLLYLRSYWGEYLPNWHPWEDYRISYAAKKELGGGAALTLSHDIDLANWLANSRIEEYHTLHNYSSPLEVNVESGTDINLKYANGLIGHVHLNFFQKIPKREYQFEFEEASLVINFYTAEMIIMTEIGKESISVEDFDRNNLFLDQTKAFFELLSIDNPLNHSLQQIEESELIIKICEDGR